MTQTVYLRLNASGHIDLLLTLWLAFNACYR